MLLEMPGKALYVYNVINSKVFVRMCAARCQLSSCHKAVKSEELDVSIISLDTSQNGIMYYMYIRIVVAHLSGI